MTDRTRLTCAWVFQAVALAFVGCSAILAFRAMDAGQQLTAAGCAMLVAWTMPALFFMAVWIRRIHKEPDVFDHPAPSEISLSGEQTYR